MSHELSWPVHAQCTGRSDFYLTYEPGTCKVAAWAIPPDLWVTLGGLQAVLQDARSTAQGSHAWQGDHSADACLRTKLPCSPCSTWQLRLQTCVSKMVAMPCERAVYSEPGILQHWLQALPT